MATDLMTPAERARAIAAGEAADRLQCNPNIANGVARIYGCKISEFNTDPYAIAEAQMAAFERFGGDSLRVFTDLFTVCEAMGATVHKPKDDTCDLEAPAISDVALIDTLEVPDPTKDGRLPVHLQAMEILKERAGNKIGVGAGVVGPFTNAFFLIGIDAMLRLVHKDPESVHKLCRVSLEACKAFALAAMERGLGPTISEPMSSCTVVSPKTFREFSLPYLKELVDFVKAHGYNPVIHICGQTDKIWEDVANLGIAGWSIDNVASLVDCKHKVGDKTKIMGNVDPGPVMYMGTPLDVRIGTLEAILQGYDSPKGYMVMSGCSLPVETPTQNIDMMMDTVREVGYPVDPERVSFMLDAARAERGELRHMPNVFLQRENRTLEAECGQNLYQVLAAYGLVDGPCGGKGTCGKCRVEVDGAPLLACGYTLDHDVRVFTQPTETIDRIEVAGYHVPFTPDVAAPGALGVAVDIGTTTVVVSLVELATGTVLKSLTCLNAQKAYGQDVITRIHHCMDDPEGTATLAQLIRADLNRLIAQACALTQRDANRIVRVVISGNTTMVHLFCNTDPSSIAQAPFTPTLHGSVVGPADSFGLSAAPQAEVFVIPCIAAYVGGDIVAGILACDLINPARERTLFIDIGTNGEIVLADKGKLVSCSCAAGPALEGMNISCGMRAAEGAIEDVGFEGGEVHYRVIGAATRPKGLCGSGIVAAVGAAVAEGLIGPSGRLDKTSPLVHKHDGKYALALTAPGEPDAPTANDASSEIWLTQADVRQVQLSKAAILAAIIALLKERKLEIDQVEHVVVSGQFGKHLSAKSLVDAGFLPHQWESRIRYTGNTAHAGALMCLLSAEARAQSEHIEGHASYLELSTLAGYDRLFIDAMSFAKGV